MSGKQFAAGNLPKNIRQIGTNIGNTKIYLEDYVYTYLHTRDEPEDWAHRGFLLLGRMESAQGLVRYFISGLIRLQDEFFKDDVLQFDDATWVHIYQEMKKYYDDLEIVGWGQDISGASASLAAELERNHKQNFNIQKNVMLLVDKIEQDDAFYIFEKNVMHRREGYYVYYEKNPQMQEYMIQTRKERELDIESEQLPEPDAALNYREILETRKSQLASRKWNGILYTTSLLLVLSVCVLGVSTVNNVEKMQHLEDAVAEITGQEALEPKTSEVPAMSENIDSEEQESSLEDEKQEPQEEEGAEENDATVDEGSDTDKEESNPDDQEEQISSDSLSETSNNQDTIELTEAQTWLLQGYYIVKKGDSLVGISKRIYGTTDKVDRICELNDIEDVDKIYEGQKLMLP